MTKNSKNQQILLNNIGCIPLSTTESSVGGGISILSGIPSISVIIGMFIPTITDVTIQSTFISLSLIMFGFLLFLKNIPE